jgi:hypothetical protein
VSRLPGGLHHFRDLLHRGEHCFKSYVEIGPEDVYDIADYLFDKFLMLRGADTLQLREEISV